MPMGDWTPPPGWVWSDAVGWIRQTPNQECRLGMEEIHNLRAENERLKATLPMQTLAVQQAEIERLTAALTLIAGFGSVNLAGEWEHGLRDIIRSMTDCARNAIEQKVDDG
jgi:hypothetical protein